MYLVYMMNEFGEIQFVGFTPDYVAARRYVSEYNRPHQFWDYYFVKVGAL